jgi:16S rRNA (cytosine967-C5)-methyltransferase
MKTARELALVVLLELTRTGHTKDQVLNSLQKEFASLARRDLRFSHALIAGVLRWKLRLDHAIRPFIRWESTHDILKWILRLAFYELYFHQAAPHAVVNECVALGQSKKERSFVNAVLRRALRENALVDLAPQLDRCRSDLQAFYGQLFPQQVAANAISYSCPPWIIQKLEKELSPEAAQNILSLSLKIPPVTIRFSQKVSQEEREKMQAENSEMRAMPGTRFAFQVPSFSEAFFQSYVQGGMVWVQELGSQLTSIFLNPSPSDVILDAFAGAGGKTAHIIDLCPNAEIYALEKKPSRVQQLRKIATSATILEMDLFQYQPKCQFSKILVDPPCSGLGTLAKNPDLKWRLKGEDWASLTKIQRTALMRVSDWVKDSGIITYSVCSFLREETEEIIERFLSARSDFALRPLPDIPELKPWTKRGFFKVIPGDIDESGYFICQLQRRR